MLLRHCAPSAPEGVQQQVAARGYEGRSLSKCTRASCLDPETIPPMARPDILPYPLHFSVVVATKACRHERTNVQTVSRLACV